MLSSLAPGRPIRHLRTLTTQSPVQQHVLLDASCYKVLPAIKPTVHFGSDHALEHFFLQPVHNRNPFAQQLDELRKTPDFKKQLKRYQKSLDESLSGRITKSAVGTLVAMGAYYISQYTQSPIAGILAGGAAHPFLDGISRNIVKHWKKPPTIIVRRDSLEALHGHVQELGTHWPRLTQSQSSETTSGIWTLLNWEKQTASPGNPTVLVLVAMISRYKEHQDALKAALPKIRDSALAQKELLPTLRQIMNRDNYGSITSFEDNPIIQKALIEMHTLSEQERATSGEHHKLAAAERAQYITHLKRSIPKLIDYLQGDTLA